MDVTSDGDVDMWSVTNTERDNVVFLGSFFQNFSVM